ADKVMVYEPDAMARYSISINHEREPWKDVRVRKAVDLVFDRQAALKVNGRGYVGSIFVRPWGMKTEDVLKLPGYRQPKDADIAEAKRLLAEAGYAQGFKTTILCQTGGPREQQAVVIKDQLAKIGIDAELVLIEYAILIDRAQRGAFDLLTANWTDNTGDPDETLNTYYHSRASRNYSRFNETEVDALIEKQARTIDETARKVILAEIEQKVTDRVAMVIQFWDVWQIGAWKEVKNFDPGPGLHPWGQYDQMWLAK
ncbi:MAG: ABC transporter substrate-binding protein, partial [Chloroflexota bacterium]